MIDVQRELFASPEGLALSRAFDAGQIDADELQRRLSSLFDSPKGTAILEGVMRHHGVPLKSDSPDNPGSRSRADRSDNKRSGGQRMGQSSSRGEPSPLRPGVVALVLLALAIGLGFVVFAVVGARG